MPKLPKEAYDPASGQELKDIILDSIDAETVIEEMMKPETKGMKQTSANQYVISLKPGEPIQCIPASDGKPENMKNSIDNEKGEK